MYTDMVSFWTQTRTALNEDKMAVSTACSPCPADPLRQPNPHEAMTIKTSWNLVKATL